MTPDLGIETGPHWWESSALNTAPSQHPNEFASFCIDNRTRQMAISRVCQHGERYLAIRFRLKQTKLCVIRLFII